MEILITFENRFDATLFAKVLKDAGVRCLMMPTPRSLSASCGVCVLINDDKALNIIQNNHDLAYHEIYQKENDNYHLLVRR